MYRFFYLLAVTILFLPNSVKATVNWDQINDQYPSHHVIACPYNHPTYGCTPGQSFTVGSSGVISHIEIYGHNQLTHLPQSREHTLSIYVLNTEYDLQNAIASVTLTADTFDEFQWFYFDFSEHNIPVNPGEQYLMMWTSPGTFRWYANSYRYYRGDRFYRKNLSGEELFVIGQDQLFRIAIDNTPIPGDISKDYKIDLTDLILSLQVAAGMNPDGIQIEADVNDDVRIGIVESLYIIKENMINQ